MNLTFYLAIARLPLGLAIGIEFLGPLGVALVLSRTRLDLFWALLAMTGIFLIVPRDANSPVDLLGVLYALIAAACWAAYLLVGKQIGQRIPAGSATAYGMAFGAMLILPIGGIPALALIDHANLIPMAIGVGVLSSAIPYSLEMVAMKNLDSRSFGILLSLEPAIGALSAFVVIHEKLTLLQIAAILCVMTASIGNIVVSRRRPRKEILLA